MMLRPSKLFSIIFISTRQASSALLTDFIYEGSLAFIPNPSMESP